MKFMVRGIMIGITVVSIILIGVLFTHQSVSALKQGLGEIQLTNHSGWVYSLAFSRDSQFLASCGKGTVCVWRATNADLVSKCSSPLTGDEDYNSVVFLPNNGQLCAATSALGLSPSGLSIRGSLYTYDFLKSRLVSTVNGFLHAVTISPDQSTLAAVSVAAKGGIGFLQTGTEIIPSSLPSFILDHKNTFARKIAYSPDATVIAVSYNGERAPAGYVKVWSTTGQTLFAMTREQNRNPGTYNSWTADKGKSFTQETTADAVIAFADKDRLVYTQWNKIMIKDMKAWEDEPKELDMAGLSQITAIAISPNGEYLAAGDQNGILRICRINKPNSSKSLPGHSLFINALAFSPDGKLLASGGGKGPIIIWNETKWRDF